MLRSWLARSRSPTFINPPAFVVIPSRNSIQNRSPSGLDLHRLRPAITTSCLNIRPYTASAVLSISKEIYGTPLKLTLSDAQRRTIYALSSPPGKAGVAVIRISGPDALEVWKRMVKTFKKPDQIKDVLPEPWMMERVRILYPESGEILDDGLSVFFKGLSFLSFDYANTHTFGSTSSEIIYN